MPDNKDPVPFPRNPLGIFLWFLAALVGSWLALPPVAGYVGHIIMLPAFMALTTGDRLLPAPWKPQHERAVEKTGPRRRIWLTGCGIVLLGVLLAIALRVVGDSLPMETALRFFVVVVLVGGAFLGLRAIVSAI